MLTAEQIAERTEGKDGVANIRAINALYRAQDDSHLWPINGRFNATNRALRRVGELRREQGGIYGLEYCYAIEAEISTIVNGEV